MAQTITLRAQGTAERKDARFRLPAWSRFSRYCISPACPAAIHSGETAEFRKVRTGAMPASSKPASFAVCLTKAAILLTGFKSLPMLPRSLFQHWWPQSPAAGQPCQSKTDALRTIAFTAEEKTERNSSACSAGIDLEIRIMAVPCVIAHRASPRRVWSSGDRQAAPPAWLPSAP